MSGTRRVALLVAYHGSAFHGYQRQPGFASVQAELEDAWMAITGEQVVAHGSGRTDSGVHAWGQVAHVTTASTIPAEKLTHALNTYLPDEAVVRAVADVEPTFHSCHSALAKRYLYRIALGSIRPVINRGQVAWVRGELDLGAMQAGARHFLGEHDFSAFAAAGRSTSTSVRTLNSIHIWPQRGGLSLIVEGNGFLYKMVRNLVGSLIEVGRGRRHPDWLASVLESRDRQLAGATASPDGLYLWRVRYHKDPFLCC